MKTTNGNPLLRANRVVSVILATTFVLFTVGLPIVVVSCPMMTAGMLPCCAEKPSTGTEAVSSLVNSSCCASKIVANRSTVEYVHVKNDIPTVAITVLAPVVLTDLHLPQYLFHTFGSPSPPGADDVPIFLSTLLI